MYNFDDMCQYASIYCYCIVWLKRSFPLPLIDFYVFNDWSVDMQL